MTRPNIRSVSAKLFKCSRYDGQVFRRGTEPLACGGGSERVSGEEYRFRCVIAVHGQLAERQLTERQLAERQLAERTVGRMDNWPNGQLAEWTIGRMDN